MRVGLSKRVAWWTVALAATANGDARAQTPPAGAAAAPLSQPADLDPAAAPAATPDLSSQFNAAGAAAATATRAAAASARMAQSPEMFGDSMTLAQLSIGTVVFGIGSDFVFTDTVATFPIGHIGARVSDQNHPIPQDRATYRYSYFENVASLNSTVFDAGPGTTFFSQRSLSVHTVGVEKAFHDGLWSIELRMPFAERKNFTEIVPAGAYEFERSLLYGGEGNLFISTKLLLHEGKDTALATGLAIDTPTGRDASLAVDQTTYAEYRNNALYLTPYLAALWTPTERVFFQAWAGVDVPVGDNKLAVFNGVGGGVGSQIADLPIDQLTLVTADLLTGVWLYRDRTDLWINGAALITEFHYTGSVEDPQGVVFEDSSFFTDDYIAQPSALGRFDVTNVTSAVHLQVRPGWSIRIGGVFPIDDQWFDSEFSLQSIMQF